MIVQVVLIFVVIFLLITFLKGQWNEQYWKKRGVKFHQRNKLFGPFWDFMVQDRALFEIISDIYKEHKDDGMVGLGSTLNPMLFVTDPKIIQQVLQTDFHSFYHRGVDAQPGDKLADNVLFMNGNRWKLVRQSVTPLFTASKLKSMYYIMDKSARDFVRYLDDNPDRLKGDTYNLLATFCCAAVGASVFGITTKSVFDSPFLQMARKALESNFVNDLQFTLLVQIPWLFRMLGMSLFGKHEALFISAIKKTIRQREIENVKKHDFADLCVNLQKSGELRDTDTGLVLEPTDELMAAQGFFFFIAGVEPSATALFCTLMELGRNPKVLNRLHEEIDAAFENNNGDITYDIVMELKYPDMVLSEGLRLYPPVTQLLRQCTQDTVVPEKKIKIEKGTKVLLSIFELQRDPKHFPNPEEFIPERFESKEVSEFFMPFGKGQRTCIGNRFSRIQVKTGLIYLLRYYTVKTVINGDKIKYHKKPFQLYPSNVDVQLLRRKNVAR